MLGVSLRLRSLNVAKSCVSSRIALPLAAAIKLLASVRYFSMPSNNNAKTSAKISAAIVARQDLKGKNDGKNDGERKEVRVKLELE